MEHMKLSFAEKLHLVMEKMEKTEAEISAKKLQVLEVKLLGGDAEELLFEWRVLESNMDLLEHAAKVMKTHLTELELLAVESEFWMLLE
ncbi:hypothetical protein Tco_1260781 [Tanacetum coccineum]